MTHYKTMIQSEWLGQWDLPAGRDVIVRIDDVKRFVPEQKKTKLVDGKRVPEKVKRIAITFVGKRKGWLAGPVSQKAIAKMYGPHVEEWKGKLIALYVDESVEFGRERTGGIRVRPQAPRGKETADPLDVEPPQEKVEQLERARQMVHSSETGEVGYGPREPGSDDA